MMFELQRHSQDDSNVPHYGKLLEFIDLRAQVSEATTECKSLKCSTQALPSQVHTQARQATVGDSCRYVGRQASLICV